MRTTFLVFLTLIAVGAGCVGGGEVKTCYQVQNGQDNPRIVISQNVDEGTADLTILNEDWSSPLTTPGRISDGKVFYTNGDYFEILEDSIVGHQPNLSEGFSATIDGLTAVKTDCQK